jgi:hypothetical protein
MLSCGMIDISNLIKIGAGVQAVLRFCLRNMRGCNIDITDGSDLRIMPLTWGQVP